MDTALTTKRPLPTEESLAGQPATGEYVPTMISRPMPEMPAIGDSVSGSSIAGGIDEIDTATVRNPRFHGRQETPSVPGTAASEFPDEAPVAEVPAPEPEDVQDSLVGPIVVEVTGTKTALEPGPEPAPAESAAAEAIASGVAAAPEPEVADEAPTGPTPFDPTVIRPSRAWPAGPWAAESRRELRGEEPPTAYYRRLPTMPPAESEAAAGAPEAATPVAEPAGAAAAFDLADNLRTVERLRASYLDSKNVTTLHLALEINKVGVESAPADDPTAQALALSLRCTLLRLAYERDKNEAQLREAIAAGRLAKSLFKPTDAGFSKALNSLATALQDEYTRTRDPAILTEALALYREAVRALPEGHPELPSMFSNIGNVLMTQGLAERSPELLDEAIHSAREAVGTSDPGDAAYATRQASLGMALVAHCANCSGPAAELDEAERLFNAALATLPASHALRPQVQNYLAGISALRYA
jgi:hypothetical protein